MIDRNPDINVDERDVPAWCYIEPGNMLQRYARSAKVPFGVARKKVVKFTKGGFRSTRYKTISLVIRVTDRHRMQQAIPAKV